MRGACSRDEQDTALTTRTDTTERARCLEAVRFTWMCPSCRTVQDEGERMSSGRCRTCVHAHGWVEAWQRSLRLQGRR
jgi:hypothetical protein